MLYLNCTQETPLCTITLKPPADHTLIKAYELYNNSIAGSNEKIIKQEINPFGQFNFRRGSIYLMFVNIDNVATQTITVEVLGAMHGIVNYSV